MKPDKKFTIRLKAAIESKLIQAGIINNMIQHPNIDNSEKNIRWYEFMQSLETITPEYLQGYSTNEIPG